MFLLRQAHTRVPRGLAYRTLTSEVGGKHVPYGASGAGYYSDHTKGCYNVMDRLGEMTHTALNLTLANRAARGAAAANEAFTVMDMGTADAGTSMNLMGSLLDAVRRAEPETQIVVVYEDQASNDWNSVFNRVHNLLPGAPPSYLRNHAGRNVVVYACGNSFYDTCAPDASVDLCVSSTAMHWLTRCPVLIPDALHSACTEDTAAIEAFEAQAARDWGDIWGKRAKELKVGGVASIANFAVDTEGRFLGKSEHVGQSMHHEFADVWREMVDDGSITEAEYQNTNFPNHYRTLKETEAAFVDNGSPFSCFSLGLRLIDGKTDVVRCPYHERWQREGGDAAAHAKRFVPTTRTWSNSTFFSGLNVSRSVEEREGIVDTMFARYEARIAADPDNHAMDYTHSYVNIEKVST